MKLLIVNADDFGASPGTNRGIIEAHRRGIVTSTSLLVGAAGSRDAAARLADAPALDVGLHLDLDRIASSVVPDALEDQRRAFGDLLGTEPTHVDSHHDAHRDPRIWPHVRRFARHHRLPLRGHSAARVCAGFYGQWNGETHPEQIGLAGLAALLREHVPEGVTELSCHPGYLDPLLRSSYAVERELELQTLCEAAARGLLASLGIRLISFRDLPGRPAPVEPEEAR
jgi:predicted glycoside hydrolase/deacetylase ChbG (UPF0249 family)